MRIAFDMLIVEQERNEALQTTCILLNELAMLDNTHEYIIITGQPGEYNLQESAENIHLHPVKMSTRLGILTQHQLLLPGILQRLQPDILHVPNAIAPISWNGPFVIAVHNIPALNKELQAAHIHICIYWQRLQCESMQRAQCIIAASEHLERTEHTRNELNLNWLEGKKRIYVMNNETQAQVALRVYYETLEQVSNVSHGSKRETTQSRYATGQERALVVHPDVSIIIPASRLMEAEQALEALSRQQYAGKIEILMVGPPARQLGTRWPIRVIHSEATYKPGKARNLGAAQAGGDVLLFLDDDMVVAANWVEQNVQALKQKEVGAVGAYMPGKTQTFYARCTDFTNYGHYQHKRAMDEPLGAGSIAMYKTLFVELGGFDEELATSEDIELCQRIRQRGYRTMYRPEIIVIHDHHYDTLRKFLKHNYTCGYQAGLETKIRQNDKKLQKLLTTAIVRYPLLFLLLLPMLALLGATKIVGLNIHDHRGILLYAPYIFLGKLAYQYGVFMCLLRDERINRGI